MQLVLKQTLCHSDWKISLYIFLHLKNDIWHMHQQADTVRQSYSELCSICLRGSRGSRLSCMCFRGCEGLIDKQGVYFKTL